MIETSRLSCAYTNKVLRSVTEPRPNTAKRRSGDPSASGVELRVSIFGFMATKCDPWGEGGTEEEAIAESRATTTETIALEQWEEEGGKWVDFIANG